MKIIYSNECNMGFGGIEKIHPFDARKYGRAWKSICQTLPNEKVLHYFLAPDCPIDERDLCQVHTKAYLQKLKSSVYVAEALEMPFLRILPMFLLEKAILQPMRWATSGTVLGARAALETGLAIHLGGGFHHAKPEHGEGFCLYSDIGIAIQVLRRDGLLAEDEGVVYVDLDAHQGNGVAHVFETDRRVFLFDMYNAQLYPQNDLLASRRCDRPFPVRNGIKDQEYLGILRDLLPSFLEKSISQRKIGLAIYNAGTDIYEGDPLGRMSVSVGGILERDLYVLEQLRARGIPTLMLPSGGYTKVSYQLIANSVIQCLFLYGAFSKL